MRPARLALRSVAPFLVSLPLLWILQGALPQYYSFVFVNIAVNVILAVSLNVVNGFTGQFSIGHAAFMAVGAYTAALVTTGMESFQLARRRTRWSSSWRSWPGWRRRLSPG
jgi:branched-chain amino acid transport system permease protein